MLATAARRHLEAQVCGWVGWHYSGCMGQSGAGQGSVKCVALLEVAGGRQGSRQTGTHQHMQHRSASHMLPSWTQAVTHGRRLAHPKRSRAARTCRHVQLSRAAQVLVSSVHLRSKEWQRSINMAWLNLRGSLQDDSSKLCCSHLHRRMQCNIMNRCCQIPACGQRSVHSLARPGPAGE